MRIFDTRIMEGVDFDEYLQLPGLSYSDIKNDGKRITPTDKMRFGTLVDTYVFEPAKYNYEQYDLVQPIAQQIVTDLGPLIKHGRRQLAVTCTMVHKGFYLYYRGRPDLVAGGLIIDLKVSELPILQSIQHFGYNRQVNGYAIPLQSRGGLIYSIHPKTHKVQKQAITNEVTWWEQIVLKYGKPI
jgi:hypothetical protein